MKRQALAAFVTDTHPLIYYATGNHRRLSRRGRLAFAGFEQGRVQMHVPAPVVLEIWLLHKGGRIAVPSSLVAWWQALDSLALIHVPLTKEEILAAISLNWAHGDVFDRMIVGTAQTLALPLLTADAAITESGLVEVYW